MYELTDEQKLIVSHEGDLVINAFAGCGKTSSLYDYAKARPNKRILYLVFNKSLQKEAETKFKSLPYVNVKTSHSLAFNKLRVRYDTIKKYGTYKPYDILEEFDIPFSVDASIMCHHALTLFELYCNNSEDTIKDIELLSHVNSESIQFLQKRGKNNKTMLSRVYSLAQTIWDRMLDGTMQITHSFYLKKYQLSKPTISCDYLFCDELQDYSGVMIDVVKNQKATKIMVGDTNQCLIEGSMIEMGDGSKKPIEKITVGDEVLSSYGQSKFGSSKVLEVFKKPVLEKLIKITLEDGSEIVSTKKHTHFSSFIEGVSPNKHIVYLMYKEGVGYRMGLSSVTTEGGMFKGFAQRCRQELADKSWILKVYDSKEDARIDEYVLSLKYGIPKLMFKERSEVGKNKNSFTNEMILKMYSLVDFSRVEQLFNDFSLEKGYPHHVVQSNGDRRNFQVSLVGGKTGTHRYSFVSNRDSDKKMLEDLGLKPRRSKESGWRIESARRKFSEVIDIFNLLKEKMPITLRLTAKLKKGVHPLDFMPASHIREGMAMYTKDDELKVVTSVEEVVYEGCVFDLNIDKTYNFIANSIITHNSVYGWRGAVDTIESLTYPKLYLSQSFRFHQEIADLAEYVINLKSLVYGKDMSVKIKGSVGLTPNGLTAVLCRSNAKILDYFITEVIPNNRRVFMEGGLVGYSLLTSTKSILFDILVIKEGSSDYIRNGLVRRLETLENLKSYAEQSNDNELLLSIKIVERYGKSLYHIIPSIKDYCVDTKDKCDIVVSTLHKCKGMTYETVLVQDDFITLKDIEVQLAKGVSDAIIAEQINILYVAVTRASHNVYLENPINGISEILYDKTVGIENTTNNIKVIDVGSVSDNKRIAVAKEVAPKQPIEQQDYLAGIQALLDELKASGVTDPQEIKRQMESV